jgi:hypothetical protein
VIIVCDAPRCVRGLVHLAGGWADPCKVCGGLGGVRSTMKKILDVLAVKN